MNAIVMIPIVIFVVAFIIGLTHDLRNNLGVRFWSMLITGIPFAVLAGLIFWSWHAVLYGMAVGAILAVVWMFFRDDEPNLIEKIVFMLMSTGY